MEKRQRKNTLLGWILCLPPLVFMLTGCGPPSIDDYLDMATKAYKKGECQRVLHNIQNVSKLAPYKLNRYQYGPEIKMYQDCQITYGQEQGGLAVKAGRLEEALVWYSQASLVIVNDPRCREAGQKAIEVKEMLALKYAEKAREAALSGEREKALAFAGSSYLYGNKEIFNELDAIMDPGVAVSSFLGQDHDITPLSFSGPVATNSI